MKRWFIVLVVIALGVLVYLIRVDRDRSPGLLDRVQRAHEEAEAFKQARFLAEFTEEEIAKVKEQALREGKLRNPPIITSGPPVTDPDELPPGLNALLDEIIAETTGGHDDTDESRQVSVVKSISFDLTEITIDEDRITPSDGLSRLGEIFGRPSRVVAYQKRTDPAQEEVEHTWDELGITATASSDKLDSMKIVLNPGPAPGRGLARSPFRGMLSVGGIEIDASANDEVIKRAQSKHPGFGSIHSESGEPIYVTISFLTEAKVEELKKSPLWRARYTDEEADTLDSSEAPSTAR